MPDESCQSPFNGGLIKMEGIFCAALPIPLFMWDVISFTAHTHTQHVIRLTTRAYFSPWVICSAQFYSAKSCIFLLWKKSSGKHQDSMMHQIWQHCEDTKPETLILYRRLNWTKRLENVLFSWTGYFFFSLAYIEVIKLLTSLSCYNDILKTSWKN